MFVKFRVAAMTALSNAAVTDTIIIIIIIIIIITTTVDTIVMRAESWGRWGAICGRGGSHAIAVLGRLLYALIRGGWGGVV